MASLLDQINRANKSVQENMRRGGVSMIEATGAVLNEIYGLNLPLTKVYRVTPSDPNFIKAHEIEEIGEQQ